MKEMQQEQRKWEVEQVPCSSDLLQFVQTTAQSEVTPHCAIPSFQEKTPTH